MSFDSHDFVLYSFYGLVHLSIFVPFLVVLAAHIHLRLTLAHVAYPSNNYFTDENGNMFLEQRYMH